MNHLNSNVISKDLVEQILTSQRILELQILLQLQGFNKNHKVLDHDNFENTEEKFNMPTNKEAVADEDSEEDEQPDFSNTDNIECELNLY